MYLQAMTLRDIVNPNGTHIMEPMISGETNCRSKLRWPHQIKPPRASWILWEKFLTYGLTLMERELLSPLGRWYEGRQHLKYGTVYNEKTKRVYKRQSGRWNIYKCTNSRKSILKKCGTQAENPKKNLLKFSKYPEDKGNDIRSQLRERILMIARDGSYNYGVSAF